VRVFLEELNELARQYAGRVQFTFVYILEAHATDEWPIASINDQLPQHKSLRDRMEAASLFQQSYPLDPSIELVLDNEENEFNATYPSWPFRYWIVHDGRIVVKAMPENDCATLKQLRQFLASI